MNKTLFLGLLVIALVIGFIGCDNVNGTTTYSVTFNANGGSNVPTITGITSGATITLPENPTKVDNDFYGWFLDNETFQNQFTSATVITSNLTVYAKWTPTVSTTYSVTFNANGGSNVPTITGITSGATITLPQNPTRTDYIFGGWFIDNNIFEDEFTSSTVITSNITVYAKWIPSIQQLNGGQWDIALIAQGSFTQAEIDAIQERIDALDLTDFQGYINKVMFERGATAGHTLNNAGTPQATADVTVGHTATTANIMTALTTAKSDVEDTRNPQPPREFLSLTFEGRTTVLKASPRIDQAVIDEIIADTEDTFNGASEGNRRVITTGVATWTLVEEAIDGGWKIVDYDNGRAVAISDRSSGRRVILELVDIGRMVLEAALATENPTFTGGNGIALVGSGSFTQTEIDAIQERIDELDLTDFQGYINKVIFERGTTAGHTLNDEGTPQATADVTVGHTATAANIMTALNAAKSDVEDTRNPQPPREFLSLTFEGRTTVLKASPRIEQATIEAIRADTENGFHTVLNDVEKRLITIRIASWTLVEKVISGGWELVCRDTDGRAIINSNNSNVGLAVTFELDDIMGIVGLPQPPQHSASVLGGHAQ